MLIGKDVASQGKDKNRVVGDRCPGNGEVGLGERNDGGVAGSKKKDEGRDREIVRSWDVNMVTGCGCCDCCCDCCCVIVVSREMRID